MKNLERFKQALNWQPVDRLLTYDFVDSTPILTQYGGYDPSRSYTREELIEINARAFRNIGVDVTRYVFDPVNRPMGARIQNWVRFLGIDPGEWQVSQTGGTNWLSRRPFSTLKELEKHLPQMPRYEDMAQWYVPMLRQIQDIFDQYDIVYIGGVEGPVSGAYIYTDTELFCTAIYDAPELVAHIMDCLGMYSAHIARAFAENTRVPLLFMGEDIAASTGPIFNPKFIREQALPRWRWITEPLKQNGCKFLYHSDGRYGRLLPILFAELGADGLNPIERNGCNDIFEIRKQYPDKLLFGNVCCAQTLPYGTLGDVEDETLEIVERIGPDGGIFIGSSSEVHDLVPPENAAQMYATVHEYGAYPIDVERIRARRAELRRDGNLQLRTDSPL